MRSDAQHFGILAQGDARGKKRSRRFLNPAFRKVLRWSLLLLLVWTVLDVIRIRAASGDQAKKEADILGKERIFIVSIHWNNEAILRSHWVPAVVALAEELGRDNVFVSVYESGSWDDSKGALRMLDRQLADAGIPRQVTLDSSTHQDIISGPPSEKDWIETPDGRTQLRRVPYLAQLRNLAMEPFYSANNQSHPFDKILFLNDVAFTVEAVRTLLNTRDGDYAAACSLDFSRPPSFYDTFALRDSQGRPALMQKWPYFRAGESRNAVLRSQPVPVRSCWNGMVAMDAAPFRASPPIEFRGISDSLSLHHLEGSECCLIHADNPLSPRNGVWLNPNVRVGYSPGAYESVNPKNGRLWISTFTMVRGLWLNRLLRWFTVEWFTESTISRRLRLWEKASKANIERGAFCIINEMHILVSNGWAHV